MVKKFQSVEEVLEDLYEIKVVVNPIHEKIEKV